MLSLCLLDSFWYCHVRSKLNPCAGHLNLERLCPVYHLSCCRESAAVVQARVLQVTRGSNPGALLLLPRSRLVLPLPEETPPGDRDAFAWGRYLNRDFLRLHPDGHSLLLVDAALEFMEGERRHLETFVFGLQAASSVQWQEWPGSLMDPQQEQSRQDLLVGITIQLHSGTLHNLTSLSLQAERGISRRFRLPEDIAVHPPLPAATAAPPPLLSFGFFPLLLTQPPPSLRLVADDGTSSALEQRLREEHPGVVVVVLGCASSSPVAGKHRRVRRARQYWVVLARAEDRLAVHARPPAGFEAEMPRKREWEALLSAKMPRRLELHVCTPIGSVRYTLEADRGLELDAGEAVQHARRATGHLMRGLVLHWNRLAGVEGRLRHQDAGEAHASGTGALLEVPVLASETLQLRRPHRGGGRNCRPRDARAVEARSAGAPAETAAIVAVVDDLPVNLQDVYEYNE